MEGNVLSVHDLRKSYEGFSLQGVSFSVPAGCIVGLVGANGAGKTTVMKSVLGLVYPDGGSVRLFGQEVSKGQQGYVGARAFGELRQKVAFVPDVCGLPGDLRLRNVGSLYGRGYERWDGALFSSLCVEFGLPAEKRVSELSRGMGMKLSLACALSTHPLLLMLDEATAGLDPLARDEVLRILRRFVADEGCGILMSSHITSDLEKSADRVVCLDAGRMVFSRDADELWNLAGVARCGSGDLQALVASGAYETGSLRVMRNPYSCDVLVPDRFAFAEAFPEISVERASLDEYLSLTLRGEQL